MRYNKKAAATQKKMKKIMTIFGAMFITSVILTSCGGSSIENNARDNSIKSDSKGAETGPAACDCMEQFKYFKQDGGMSYIDMNKLNSCIDKFKDKNISDFLEGVNNAENNARQKCHH